MPRINLFQNGFVDPGTHYTDSFLVPTTGLNDRLEVQIIVRQQDLRDPALAFAFTVEISDDNINWDNRYTMTSVGSPTWGNHPPSIDFWTSVFAGKYVRGALTTNNRIRVQIDVEDKAKGTIE